MNDLKIFDGEIKTMTLKEITDLLDVRHNDAMKIVEKMAEATEFGLLRKFRSKQKTGFGEKDLDTYLLDKRQSIAVASKLNTALLMRVIDRWHELEQSAQQPAINPANLTRMQLIQIALEAEQELQEANQKIEALEPKAKALDRISGSEGSQCITDAAKALNIQPKKFFQTLQEMRWIYKRAGGKSYVGYQDKIQQGLVEHKITTVSRSDGTEKSVEQALITPKGITKLSVLIA